jgi:hypothetical protein
MTEVKWNTADLARRVQDDRPLSEELTDMNVAASWRNILLQVIAEEYNVEFHHRNNISLEWLNLGWRTD